MQKFVLLLLILLTGFIQVSARVWTLDDIRLTWSHFQPTVNTTGNGNLAFVATKLRYKMIPHDDGQHLLFTTETQIDQSLSTINKNFLVNATSAQKQDLLNHEKCHVILAYIYNKKLQQQVRQHQFQKGTKKELDSIFMVVLSELKEQNQVYDGETAHGEHKGTQEKWQENLLRELNFLYADDELNKPLSLSLARPALIKFNDPDEYEYQKVKLVFADEFENDSNGWLKNQDKDTGVFKDIKNGKLEINNTKPSGNYTQSIKTDIDFSRDFELQFSFMIRQSIAKREKTGGVYWGADTVPGYSWVSIGRKDMELVNCHGGDHKNDERKYIPIYPALKENKSYKIAIRKVKDRYLLFLNDEFRTELPFRILPGKDLSCGVRPGCSMVYDYLRIYYLD